MRKSGLILFLILFLAAMTPAQTTTFNGVIKDLSNTPIPTGQVSFALKPSVDTTISGQGRFVPSTTFCEIHNPAVVSTTGTGTITVVVGTAQAWQAGDKIIFAGTADGTLNASSVATPYTITLVNSPTSFNFTQAGTHTNGAGGTVGGLYANGGTGACNVMQNSAITPANTYYSVSLWPIFSLTSSFNTYAIGSGPVDISTVVPTPGQQPAYSFVDIFQNQTIGGLKTFSSVVTFSAGLSGSGSLGALTAGSGILGTPNTFSVLQTFGAGLTGSGTLGTLTAGSGILANPSTWSAAQLFNSGITSTGGFTATAGINILGVQVLNNKQYADKASGADPCAQIVTAQNALPSTGGVVDATGFQGILPACAGGFILGSRTKPVTLLVAASTLTVNNSIVVSPLSEIVGTGSNGPVAGSNILAGGSFPVSTPIIQVDSSGVTFDARIRHLVLDCGASPPAGCIGVDMGQGEEGTVVDDVLINHATGVCVNSQTAFAENYRLTGISCFPFSTNTTSNGIQLVGNSDNISITDFTYVKSGTQNTAAAISCNNCLLNVGGRTHIEGVVDGAFFTGANASGSVIGVSAGNGAGGNVVNGVHIGSTVASAIAVMDLRGFGVTNSIKNDIAAFNHLCTDTTLSLYVMNGLQNGLLTNCSTLNSIFNTSIKVKDAGTCTMVAGTCAAQSLSRTYSTAPNCFLTWTGTGSLTGILKAPSTTTTVTPASSAGADTAQVNWVCFGN